jgi:hypothetical protein
MELAMSVTVHLALLLTAAATTIADGFIRAHA